MVKNIIDLLGKRFTKLTVVSLNERSGRGRTYWNCQCDCGNLCVVRSDALREDRTKSCGCLGKFFFDKEQILEAHTRYIYNNIPPSKIAQEYGCSGSVIIKNFKKYNLLIKKTGYANRQYVLNEHIFDDINTEEKAYWLGFLYADGGVIVKNRTYQTTLSLAKKDKEMVQLFSQFIFGQDRGKLERGSKTKNSSDMYRVVICSKYITTKLTAMGCPPKKSLILTFPQWLNKNLYNHFIRGYFDGDGCIGLYNDNGYWRARFNIVSTKEFNNKLSEIFCEMNIRSTQVLTHRVKEGTNCFTILVSGNRQIQMLLDWIYKDATIYLERKYKKYVELKELNKKIDNKYI